MSNDLQVLERVPTGIPGLDRILEGGLLKGGVYIVQGPPGSGKTVLGNQICFHHAAQGGQAVYVTLLAESHTRMLAHLRRMSFFDPSLIPDRLYYISAFKVLEADGLEGLIRTLRNASTVRKASLLILDGLISAAESAPSDREFKKFIHELQSITGMIDCTAIMLKSNGPERSIPPEHTMVDGIIELTNELVGLKSARHLRVCKLRGAAQIGGQHTLEISDEGIMVWPRIETQLRLSSTEPRTQPAETRKMSLGISRLDEMLEGGLPSHSMTMLLGPSGSGKTTFGLQFLAEGARKGEPGVYFGFYERPEILLRKANRIGLPLEGVQARGLLDLLRYTPVEGVIDIFGERLLSAVRRTQARRLFIDGIQGFQLAADFPERIRDVFTAMTEELERLGVTTVYTMETPDLLGPRIEVPITGVSAMTHNIILLRHVELKSQLYRLISILKLRDSNYDSTIREFRITEQGIVVADTFGSADQLMSGMAHATAVEVEPEPRSDPPSPRKGRDTGRKRKA